MTVAPYKVAGRYALGPSLGAGGMAQVFRAHDELLGRDVAVKLFGASVDPRGPDRVRAEMRTLAGLSHPALVAVYDAGTDVPTSGSPRAFLVMALVEGPSLSQQLLDGPLPVERVRSIGVRVGDALDFVHSRGVVHRDIKPANVLLDREGLAYLADFGIARALGQPTLTTAGQILGTAAFLSPEQVGGQPVTTASDVYALGLVMLEALTGRREYPGTSVETALARLSRPPVIDVDLPALWCGLLADMTARDPLGRPTAAKVASVLRGEPAPAFDLSLKARIGTATGLADPNVSQPTKSFTGELGGAGTSDATTAVFEVRNRVARGHKVAAAAVGVVALAAIGFAIASAATKDRSAPLPSGVTSSPTSAAAAQLDRDIVRLRQLVTP